MTDSTGMKPVDPNKKWGGAVNMTWAEFIMWAVAMSVGSAIGTTIGLVMAFWQNGLL